MKKYLLTCMGLTLLLTSLSAQTVFFRLNIQESTLTWTGKAALGAYDLKGSILPKQGFLEASGDSVVSATLVIDMNTISSDIQRLTNHLKSEDFFEVDKYPRSTFVLNMPIPMASGKSEARGTARIKDAEGAIRFPVSLEQNGDRLTARGTAVIDRTAFGIKYRSPNFFENLGNQAIADEFELSFSLIFQPQ